MATDPEGVVEFKIGTKKYRLFFGMRARKEVERHYDKPFFRAIQDAMPQLAPEDMDDKVKVAEASANIRLTDVAKLFEFAMLKHQPDTEEWDADDMIDQLGLVRVSELIGEALSASMIEEGKDTQNPPQPSRKRKTGSRS